MEEAANKQHTHPNTVLHCLYGYYHLGYSKSELAQVYNKYVKTIANLIKVYEDPGTYKRVKHVTDKRKLKISRLAFIGVHGVIDPLGVQIFRPFAAFDMSRGFENCRWMVQGYFNPFDQLANEHRTTPAVFDGIEEEEQTDELEFMTRYYDT
ncbi:hypothetical protein PHMEG_00012009 [Phytophthora megakarya]|uniref:Uncharacterized protein n=1 Tax=Phytophthora megakarya TaxID=4795 RepID=A0A225WAB4_9STRA|nr:hypothetical protein PHMEG_00012009 [Phytophthora megakarya]